MQTYQISAATTASLVMRAVICMMITTTDVVIQLRTKVAISFFLSFFLPIFLSFFLSFFLSLFLSFFSFFDFCIGQGTCHDHQWEGHHWYRITGDAGKKMPDSPPGE